MAQSKHFPKLTFARWDLSVRAAIRANVPHLTIAPPGVGKSTAAAVLATDPALGFDNFLVLIGSTIDAVDLGIPVYDSASGTITRHAMVELERACEAPTLILLDELSCAPESVRAALLDVVFSRRLPNGAQLHEGTRVLAALNDPEHAPDASETQPSLTNRFVGCVLEPSQSEVAAYFARRAEQESDRDPVLASWFDTFALVLAHTGTACWEYEPSAAAINEGAQWGSGRGWEQALKTAAAIESLYSEGHGRDGATADETAANLEIDQLDALAGCVGKGAAAALWAFKKYQLQFPTPEEIAADPHGADLPTAADVQIGALGVLAGVAALDCYAAWVYAARCRPEIGAASVRLLKARKVQSRSPFKIDGTRAQTRLLATIGKNIKRRTAA